MAKSRRQRTMLGRIVKRDRLIEVCSAFRDVSRKQQGRAHEAMSDHERDCRPLLLGERQELRRKLAHHVAVERHVVRQPKAVEDREQQQWVFERLSERFSLFDQQTCSLRSRLGFRRSVPFDMEEWGYERDLKLDLFATQRGSAGQGRNLVEGARELLCGFDQRRALQRPLSRFAPPFDGRFGHARLGEVMRQQLRFGRSGAGELVAQGLADAAVQNLAPALEQILISRVLNERVLEAIVGIRRQALHQQDVGLGEPFQRSLQRASSIPATARRSA